MMQTAKHWARTHWGLLLLLIAICVIYWCGATYILRTRIPDHPQMERLGWWSQSIATVIAILAAFFVALQVADIKRAGRTAAFEATAFRMQEVARLLLAHPDLYKELQRGGQLSVEAELLAEMLLDNMDTELLRQEALPDPWQDKLPSFEPWYRDLFREVPGLRQTLEKRDTWYRTELYQLKEEALRDQEGEGSTPAPTP